LGELWRFGLSDSLNQQGKPASCLPLPCSAQPATFRRKERLTAILFGLESSALFAYFLQTMPLMTASLAPYFVVFAGFNAGILIESV
jgi:hypothetical protein